MRRRRAVLWEAAFAALLGICGLGICGLGTCTGAQAQTGTSSRFVTSAAGSGAPAQADTQKAGRIFLDTAIVDVRVGGTATVVTMGRSPRSPCPSDQYVYERGRPRWLAETGRMMQAMKERATVRISFSCNAGYQSINALQFLTPPPPTTGLTAFPRRAGVEALVRPPAPEPSLRW